MFDGTVDPGLTAFVAEWQDDDVSGPAFAKQAFALAALFALFVVLPWF